MNLKEQESINDYFKDDSKFIGEFQLPDYKVMRGYIGGYGDELRLYYTKFDPPNKKASLCIVHGFGEHQGRFLHIADMFAKLNYAVHLIDLRGFGYSGGPRGSQTLKELHMDIEVLLRQVSKDIPLFLYGHAMGGLLIISFLIRNPQLKVRGIITTAPMLGFPMDRKLKGIKYIAVKYFGHYMEDLVINTKLNITGMSKNDQHIQRCFEDKLMMPLLGIGMAKSILETLNYMESKVQTFKYPILILHGKQDAVSSYHESVRFYEKCGSQDKSIKLFENGYHELQHDFEFIEMKQIIIDWCSIRLQNAGPFGILLQSRLNYDSAGCTFRACVFFGDFQIQEKIQKILISDYSFDDNIQILQQKFMKNFRRNFNQSNRPFRNNKGPRSNFKRKFSKDDSDRNNNNQSDRRPFKSSFRFKKSGKFDAFRTGKRRFRKLSENKSENLENKLDKQLEQYKSGQQVVGNSASSKLDNALDTYFSRKGSNTKENNLDRDLASYWKKNN
ncbi:unnamed protein product (macronuclear) [Paramecium tetraurelia]|uniref:Serine aminopeptidase S33 domain-containing protein n=1 Tax=Paramecium tetraurelia TaxID=5888 RepID=A0DKH0_PARTE|nr:uncharacterized protein GSPATT00017867001 [Paramecium tetraurelia]CAK83537.1 unnamed protein product [Paramecium tetraurelia]|eukprot:XP_001450934.1 hypothetical protein (macronuclear) [Paramecium tetraurelia strain d4-2]